MATINISGFGRSETEGRGLLSGVLFCSGTAPNKTDGKTLVPAVLNDDYLVPTQSLLPRGRMWNRVEGSELTELIRAISYMFTNVARRGRHLIEEMDPRTTNELLTDWERVTGLTAGADLTARRNAVLAKLRGYEDPNEPNLIDLALSMGYVAEITTYQPFVAGSAAGDALTQDNWEAAWKLSAFFGLDDSALDTLMGERSPGHTIRFFELYWDADGYPHDPDDSFAGNINAVAYHPGIQVWVFVGQSGEVQTSHDFGRTWVSQTLAGGYSSSLQELIVDGDDQFVVVGPAGGIQTSLNGVNWAAQTADGAYAGIFYGVGANDTLVVAVGDTAEIQTSLDAITWVISIPDGGFSGIFYAVTWVSTSWVIVGSGGEIQTSLDAVSWAQQAADGFAGNFLSVISDGVSTVVAVGANAEVHYSDDSGATWSSIDHGLTTSTLYQVLYTGDHFIAVGLGGDRITSADGQTWHQLDDATNSTNFGAGYGLVPQGGMLMVVGSGGSIENFYKLGDP